MAEEMDIPRFKLDVVETARSMQQQHGLKSYDYLRYRQYCTRRLRRIHKTLRMFAGTQKKYKGLVIQAEDVTDSRVLEMLLLQVERAWSYAEQLKYDHSNTDDPRLYRHYAQRMTKAEVWAKEFQNICKYVADDRTQKEVAAYVVEMTGHKAVAKKEWKLAQDSFQTAKSEYTALQAGASSTDVKNALIQRASDLSQSIRFCVYNLGGKNTSAASVAQDDAAGGGATLKWRGQSITINSEKVRTLLSTADTAVKDVAVVREQLAAAEEPSMGSINKFVDTYDKVFIAYTDAINQVKQDIAHEKEGDPAMLHLLSNCLKFRQLEHTMTRNKVLTQAHTKRHENLEAKHATKSGSTAKDGSRQAGALDIARLHDTVTQTVESMLSLPGVEDDEELAAPLNIQQQLHTALKYYFQAETFVAMGEWSNALPLYAEAEEGLREALLASKKHKVDDAEIRAAGESVRASKCACIATACLVNQDGGASKPRAGKGARLDKNYVEYSPCDAITKIPPDYVSIPCRPIFLDVARGLLPRPSISHRVTSSDKFKGAKPSVKAQPAASKPASQPRTSQAPASGDDKKGWFGGWGWGNKAAN